MFGRHRQRLASVERETGAPTDKTSAVGACAAFYNRDVELPTTHQANTVKLPAARQDGHDLGSTAGIAVAVSRWYLRLPPVARVCNRKICGHEVAQLEPRLDTAWC